MYSGIGKFLRKLRKYLTATLLCVFIVSGNACQETSGDFEIRRLLVQETDPGAVAKETEEHRTVPLADPEETFTAAGIYVYVCGAVNSPGVYLLAAGDRIFQAVEAAGGFTADARREALNLAGFVNDGQQIYVPSQQESIPVTIAADPDPVRETKISINTATKEELMQLPGIGGAKAEAIIAYRESAGRFERPEDIMLVPGIKEAAYMKLKDRITAD